MIKLSKDGLARLFYIEDENSTFSHSENYLLSSLQSTSSAPNLILVTLGATSGSCMVLLDSSITGCAVYDHQANVAKWQSKHHRTVQELIVPTFGTGAVILVDGNAAKPQGASQVCFWSLNYSRG